jgi:predicted Ser/Thr protein kinase
MSERPDLTETVATSAVSRVRSSGISRSVSSTSSSIPDEGRFVPGTLLAGRYRIIGLLGRGGMGEVYRATDLTLAQSVALKFLPASDERMLERFHNEVRVARQVSHPNVCRVYDIGESDGMPYLSMEYVDGEDLSSLLHRIGRLPNDKALEIARKICAGLAAAHDRGVIHRDLKPQNIMLNRRGEVLIMDFGLAAVASELHGAEAKSGTPAYMAPEQLKGSEVTAKSDLYALGLVLYELFTGKKPYEAKTIGELIALQEAAQVTSMTSVAADIDPDVEKVIRRCLDPNAQLRPASALSVAASLPGGDPLAAALAAGETPSPELVAAAKSEGLALRYSVPMLAFVLISLLALPWLKDITETVAASPLDIPPDALRVKAREMAASFGYVEKPGDHWIALRFREALRDYLQRMPGKKDWRKVYAGESPMLLEYRESPRLMQAPPAGLVDFSTPALKGEGMVRLAIDSRGYLRLFEAMPPLFRAATSENAVSKPAPDAAAVLRAAGFDIASFTEVPTQYTPPTPYDTWKAYRGPHPSLSNTIVTVEFASWRERLTYAQIIWPWTRPPAAREVEQQTALTRVRLTITLVCGAAFLFWISVLARRNWVRGRADRKGALRIATFMTCLAGARWFLMAHLLPSFDTIWYFFGAIGDWLFSGVIMWMLYLALEPGLRARWPKAIITWNRLLNGKFMDEQLGSHILLGVFMGIFLGFVMFLRSYWYASDQDALSLSNEIQMMGTRGWLAKLADYAFSAVWFGMIICFALFGLKRLLRWEWLAALTAAILLTFREDRVVHSNLPIVDAAVYIGLFMILLYFIIRYGLIPAMVTMLTANMLGGAALSADLTTWYAPGGIAAAVFVAGLAIFGFWRSLGNQEFAPLVQEARQ